MSEYPGFLVTAKPVDLLVTIDRPEEERPYFRHAARLRAHCRPRRGRGSGCRRLTGSDPTFTAGVDLKERLAGGVPLPRVRPNPGEVLRSFSKPVICAVNRPCVTGGLEIALSCTFVVASERAAFKDTHARLGLMPGWGLSALLPRAIGMRLAADMTVTGRVVDAAGPQVGLVNTVVAHD